MPAGYNVMGECGRMRRSVIQLSVIAGPPVNTHEALEESPRLSGTVLHEPNYHKVFFCDRENFYRSAYVSGSPRSSTSRDGPLFLPRLEVGGGVDT
jgi:hypothetical protein